MKSRILYFLLFLLIWCSLQAATEYYLKIDIVSGKRLAKLSRLVSIDKIEEDKIYAYANQKEYDFLKTTDFSYDIIPGPLAGFTPQMTSVMRELRDWDSYPTYETYVGMMNQFAIDHPDICEVYSIGTSMEGREVLVAHIGDDLEAADNEPEFYYMGQIHGDELVTYMVLLHLIDDLLSGYGSDPRIDNIIEEIDLYINPLCNPDGTYAGGNHTVAGATRSNANGIDLNRNFPDFEDGPHPDGNDYQTETLIQMDFAAEHNFVMCSNLHSGAEVVNYPWDTWSILHADDAWWQQVSHAYADAVHELAPADYMDGFDNGVTNGYQWYTTSGNHQDYMNWYHRCRDVTLELSNTKALPENQLIDHYDWNYNSLLMYMEECLYGIRGTVEDASGNPLDALITIPDHDIHHSDVVTDPAAGDYHRPIFSDNYDMEASAWGFYTQSVFNVYAPDQAVTYQNFVLEPAANGELSGVITDADSGIPLFGAYVELLDTPLEAAMTNGSGNYSLTGIPIGVYQVAVYAGGYITDTEEIILQEGENTLDLALEYTTAISFENAEFPPDFDFYSTGNADWFISDDVAHNGMYSARSGGIDHREETSLHLNIDLIDSGSINFWLKVSTEEDWDFLYFYIDNVLQDSWSGDVDWTECAYNLTTGEHQFVWEYDKDNSVSNGSDCAWIDDILFTGLPEIQTVYGDVDDNAEVEAYDASLVQRYVVEMNPGPNAPLPWQYWRMIRADVDGNMMIEAYDASLILQYYVAIINSFPVETLRTGKK